MWLTPRVVGWLQDVGFEVGEASGETRPVTWMCAAEQQADTVDQESVIA